MTRNNRRGRGGSTIKANVNGMIVTAPNNARMVQQLENLAAQTQDETERELYNQHAEHYRKNL